jgi:hypothetical protein
VVAEAVGRETLALRVLVLVVGVPVAPRLVQTAAQTQAAEAVVLEVQHLLLATAAAEL